MDDTDLTPAERAELERVDELLADPALWADPPAALGDRVVAAVARESGRADRSRSRRPGYLLGAVAASLVLAIGAGLTFRLTRPDPVVYRAGVGATALAPGASGDVSLTRTTSGWRVRLHVDGLPRRDHGQVYEAWLKDEQGVLVSIGTFNQGDDVTLWAGVSPDDFSTLTVTRELTDGNPASSGQVVLTARPHRR